MKTVKKIKQKIEDAEFCILVEVKTGTFTERKLTEYKNWIEALKWVLENESEG